MALRMSMPTWGSGDESCLFTTDSDESLSQWPPAEPVLPAQNLTGAWELEGTCTGILGTDTGECHCVAFG